MAKNEEIYDGNLVADELNYSAFFNYADFLFLESSDHPDWSQSGDFTEIDFDLLVTLKDGVKRKVPLTEYASTREVIRIPEEYARSGFLMEFVMQASFSAQLTVTAVRADTNLEDVRAMLEALLNDSGVTNPVPIGGSGGWIPNLPSQP